VDKRIRETSEQWDDVPAKVVGRRGKAPVNLEKGAAFMRMAADRGGHRVGWPKGVFRFRSHDEADQWLIANMITR